jgi:hypothetical protein
MEGGAAPSRREPWRRRRIQNLTERESDALTYNAVLLNHGVQNQRSPHDKSTDTSTTGSCVHQPHGPSGNDLTEYISNPTSVPEGIISPNNTPFIES